MKGETAMTAVHYLVWSAILTFAMLGAASLFRSQGWTWPGMQLAFGNRDNLPPATPLAGRAHRAAMNMLENLVLFTALIAAVHFAGKANAPQVQTGAALFFWARLLYWPCYLAGVVYLRTGIWLVSVVGLAMIAAAMW